MDTCLLLPVQQTLTCTLSIFIHLLVASHAHFCIPFLYTAPCKNINHSSVPQADDTDRQAELVLIAPKDWVESQETAAALKAEEELGALLATERMALLSMGWRPPSTRQVSKVLVCKLCKAHFQ